MRKVNKHYFTIRLLFVKNQLLESNFHEVEFYVNDNDSYLGFIAFDSIDSDYNSMCFIRDSSMRYEAHKIKVSFPTIDKARRWLKKQFSEYVDKDIIPTTVNIFELKVKKDNIHPVFDLLIEEVFLTPAKELISEISVHYQDVDGNFIEQLQSKNGFDARLWELYLFCFLREQGFEFNRANFRPDYIVTKGDNVVAIEAVIVSRVGEPHVGPHKEISEEEIKEKISNEMPLKFGSALYDKLKHKYWEEPYVKGHPLIISIADFHDDISMTWSFQALLNYLYGYNYKYEYNSKGELIIIPVEIEFYTKSNGTKIPAGFFKHESSKHISAVLYSNTGTLSKFNRIGKQANMGLKSCRLLRFVSLQDHSPNASVPLIHSYEVDENGFETWSEGISIFHNPNAEIPLNPSLFTNVAQHFFGTDNQIHSIFPEFFPHNSFTLNIKSR